MKIRHILFTVIVTAMLLLFFFMFRNSPQVHISFPPDGKLRYLVLDEWKDETRILVWVYVYGMNLREDTISYDPVIFSKYYFSHLNHTSEKKYDTVSICFLPDVEDFVAAPYYHDMVNTSKVYPKRTYYLSVGRDTMSIIKILEAKRKIAGIDIPVEVPEHILNSPVDSSKYEQINLRSWRQIKALSKEEWRKYNNE